MAFISRYEGLWGQGESMAKPEKIQEIEWHGDFNGHGQKRAFVGNTFI